MRRGFKAEAERMALRIREEMSLSATAPIDVFGLADHLQVSVEPLAALRKAKAKSLRFLREKDPWMFSAFTVVEDDDKLVVYNDGHAPERTASTISHELSHIIHKHVRDRFTFGCRTFNREQEAEASWQGDCILVPAAAALEVARSGIPLARAAAKYGVSPDLMRMRLNLTGALIRVRRRNQTSVGIGRRRAG